MDEETPMKRVARRMGSVVTLLLFLACLPAAAKTYVVSQRHPAASDENPGTAAKPLKTIGAAAKVVKAGDAVTIRAGVYREAVTVEASGTAEAPIVFRAADGERVVVTGADLITKWQKAEGLEGNVYAAAWPHRFISWNKTFAHPDDDFHRVIGRAEQVIVHGYLLRQVLRREELARGTFYVDLAAKRLYVWSRDNRDLTKGDVPVEASVRGVIWVNQGAWVHLKGLRFRYAANAAQKGAVQVHGHHSCLEDCVFEHANSIGCQFGGAAEAQGIVVQRCVFQHNGQMGFGACRAHGLTMVGCTVRDNNTKGYSRGWEAGANKIVLSRGVVLQDSTFLANRGNGIWFDIGNEDGRVRNCLIADNDNAGIFYEISYGLHAHDNVIIANGFGASSGAWGADGGISISSSPGCRIERNLVIGNKEGLQFREQTRSTPRITAGRGRRAQPVWNHDEVIRNNLIALNRDVQVGGWFDITDGRHWPRAMQAGVAGRAGRPAADLAARYKARDAKGQPAGLSLEDLKITFQDNVYFAAEPQGLYLWGCTWRRHRRYGSLEAVRKELKLEDGSALERPAFADFGARDLRLPADSRAIQKESYPQGSVPGVRLGRR
jgi:hypothetical protein